MTIKKTLVLYLFILSISFLSCKDKTVVLEGTSVSPTSISLVYGGSPNSQQITVTLIPENVKDVIIKWKSGDENVAVVSENGLVTATGIGYTQITVMANDRIKNIPVEVVEPKEVIDPEDVRNFSNITATDALGRKLPTYEEVGALNQNKFVGLFYWTWHTQLSKGKKANDVSKILAAHPDAIDDYNHPAWPKDEGYYYWGEPLFDYYIDTDRWVLRKHAEMLADAGVDVIIFDCTNGNFTWKESYMEICRVFTEARQDGIHTPQIAFITAFGATQGSKEAIEEIYRDLYLPKIYKDLFFMWKGKPLIMAYPENLSTDIKNHFTFRPGQPVYNQGPGRADHWGWLEIYPQHGFIRTASGYEQATVGVAQNWSKERGLTAMNAPGAFGRSYTNAKGHIAEEGAVNYGYNFQEQWDRAFELNPNFIFITGWNEWIAGRQQMWQQQYNAFPDQFNQEYSRDIEPMKGGHGDNYYYQMASNIRKFKGARPPMPISESKTITIDGQFSDWNNVKPIYNAHKGSTIHRNSSGWVGDYYTNTTGRNDFVAARVARDEQYIYFYVETAKNISPATDPAWMRLFINTDRNQETGWEGYDFIINRMSPGKKAGVEKNTSEWNWEKVGEADFNLSENKLEIRIPRSMLNLPKKIDIEFKWSDNMQNDGDIMDFYVNGDVAPLGRYNYFYTE